MAEDRGQKAEDRRQTTDDSRSPLGVEDKLRGHKLKIDDKILFHKELSGSLKSEILSPKS